MTMGQAAAKMEKDVKAVLRLAANLVAQGWAQGDRATDAEGHDCNTYSAYAANFPLIHALDRAARVYSDGRGHTQWEQVYCDAADMVRREIWALPEGEKYGAAAIQTYNDDTRRTAAHVERLLKRAARNYKWDIKLV